MVNPEEAKYPDGTPIKLGDTVDAKILRVIPDEQKIGLSIKQVHVERDRQALKEVPADGRRRRKESHYRRHDRRKRTGQGRTGRDS